MLVVPQFNMEVGTYLVFDYLLVADISMQEHGFYKFLCKFFVKKS